jgi:hypothetical protein
VIENVEGLKALFDLGGVVVVTAMLWIVWRRLNDVTDRLIDILRELREQSVLLAQANLRNLDESSTRRG